EEGGGGRIDRRRGILEGAAMGKGGVVLQGDLDGNLMELRERQPPLIQIGANLQRLLRTDVGDNVDRVPLRDHGQSRLLAASANGVARIDEMLSNLPVERSPDLGIAEIELREGNLRLRRQNVRFRALSLEVPAIDIDLAGSLSLEELRIAAHFGLRVGQRRPLQLQLCLCLLQLRLVLVLLNSKQEIALPYQCPVFEVYFLQKAFHARNELHLTDGGR